MVSQYSEQISNPMIESAVKDWREQGGLTRLEGTYCVNCNKYFYPRRFICPFCHETKLNVHKFSGKGKIINIEINNIPQIAIFGYREKIPRYMSVIKLDEGPYILGEIINVNKDIGMDQLLNKKVKYVVRKQSRSNNTTWKYGYKFKLI